MDNPFLRKAYSIRAFSMALVFVGALGNVHQAIAQQLKNADLARDFAQIVFGNDPQQHLLKWGGGDIQIAVRHSFTHPRSLEQKQMVQDQAAELSTITGIKMATTEERSANFVVIFAADIFKDSLGEFKSGVQQFFPSGNLEQTIQSLRSSGPLCFGQPLMKPNVGITAALVVLPYYADVRLLQHCMALTVAQVLGLAHQGKNISPSVFNDGIDFTRITSLTYHDSLIMRTLYDSRIKVGMTMSEASPVVVKILDEIHPEGAAH